MKRRKICILMLICCILIILSGCTQDNAETLEIQKGISEIKFLENQYISIFAKYISNDYLSDDNQIDWSLVEEDFVVLNNSIDVILIDFASIKIPSKNIVELENNFNELKILLKNKDIEGFMKNICDSYNLVSESILGSISTDEVLKNEKLAKSSLMYIGYYSKIINKNELLNYIEIFENNISKLNLNKEYIENNSYKINRIFVNIQKLKKLVLSDDFDGVIEIVFELFEML